MKKTKKYEIRLLVLVYLLCGFLFLNVALLQKPIDKVPLFLLLIIITVVSFAYFVIRKFYPDGDKFLIIFATILASVGIAVLYRLGLNIEDEQGKAIKQLVWLTAGLTAFVLIVVILPDIKRFSKYRYLYLAGTILFMAMPFFPKIGVTTLGARNWVKIGPIGFQPSELGKILFVLYLSSALSQYKELDNKKEHIRQLFEPAIVVMVCLGFLVLQRDLGSALIFFGISVTMLYIASAKVKYLITCLGLFMAGGVISYGLFGHVRRRVLIWKDLWAYANDESYQLVQGLYSISSGGILGSGVGKGLPQYIPIRSTDYIYAVICEEFGIVFAIGLLLIYFLLFYRGMRSSLATNDKFSQLIAVGLSTMIVMQVLVIIGGIYTIIPLTGITLPLVSYGGTSMLTIFVALGIIQKISEEAM